MSLLLPVGGGYCRRESTLSHDRTRQRPEEVMIKVSPRVPLSRCLWSLVFRASVSVSDISGQDFFCSSSVPRAPWLSPIQRDLRSGDSEPLTVPPCWNCASQRSTFNVQCSAPAASIQQFPRKENKFFFRSQSFFECRIHPHGDWGERSDALLGTLLGFRKLYKCSPLAEYRSLEVRSLRTASSPNILFERLPTLRAPDSRR
jgi:hypothetical protein